MAYLILNEENVNDNRCDSEKFYEFDPGDKASVDRIHQILSLRKTGAAINSAIVLAGICEKSIKTTPPTEDITFFRRLHERVKKVLPRIFLWKSSCSPGGFPDRLLNSAVQTIKNPALRKKNRRFFLVNPLLYKG